MKVSLVVATLAVGVVSQSLASESGLEQGFAKDVRPFLDTYCVSCHDKEARKAKLDLSASETVTSVAKDYPHWELVLERLRNGEMPPKKEKEQPTVERRKS